MTEDRRPHVYKSGGVWCVYFYNFRHGGHGWCFENKTTWEAAIKVALTRGQPW